MEYLVYWHGYDEKEDFWVSEQHLIHAQHILQYYQHAHRLL